MRLLNLELSNWACHNRLEVNLSSGLQIEGRNGVGKSSILEAIRFIFAKDARSYKGKIKNGQRTATVRLNFTKDGNSYLVEKNLYLNKSSTATLSINGNLVADNPTSVYNSLQDCLDERILDKLLYVPQGGLTGLVDRLSLKGGRQELDSLLGLDKFERVYEGAGREFIEKKAVYETIYKEFLKYPQDLEEKSGEEIRKHRSEIETLKKGVETESKKVEDISKRILELEREIEKLQQRRKRREELQDEISKLKIEMVKDESEAAGLRRDLEQVKDKKDRLGLLLKDEERFGKYRRIRELLSKLKNNEERLLDKREIEESRKRLDDLKKTLVGKKDAEDRLRSLDEKVMSLERGLAAGKQKRAELGEYLENLNDLDGKAKCPRCGRPLTEKHLVIERNFAMGEIRKIDGEIEGIKTYLKKELEVKKEFEGKLDLIKKNEVEAECLEKDLDAKVREKKVILVEIGRLRDGLKDSDYSGESLESVDSKIGELNRIRGETEILEREVGKGEEYAKRLSEIEKVCVRLKENLKNAGEEFNRLEFNEGVFQALQLERDRLRDERYSIKGEVEKKEFRIKEIRNRIDELEKEMKGFTELKKNLSKAEREMNLFREARDEVFHPNKGIRRYYRELYMRRLSTLLTYYFRGINQNPRYGEILFDKDYKILIRSNEGEFDIEQLSGGERVQLALALRISLIELLSPVRLLILDEPFGSLDKEHREILGEALNRIAVDGQLIIVTHILVDSLNLPEKLELGGY